VPIDPANEAHDLVMSVFGGMSKGERNRVKLRVRTAMAAQAQIEGRFLGGRPPYGYTLADAGGTTCFSSSTRTARPGRASRLGRGSRLASGRLVTGIHGQAVPESGRGYRAG
jgi:DNA invertase Pin-like site-specific DNA recombinase